MDWSLFINDPRHMSGFSVIVYLVGGALGGLLKVVAQHRGVIPLPYRTRNELHLGFLASVILGAGAAVLADGNFVTALLSGVAAGAILDSALQQRGTTRTLTIQEGPAPHREEVPPRR